MRLSYAWQRRIAYLLLVVYMTGVTVWSANNETQRRRATAAQIRSLAANAADTCATSQKLWDVAYAITAPVEYPPTADPAVAEAEAAGNAFYLRQRAKLLHGSGRPDCPPPSAVSSK